MSGHTPGPWFVVDRGSKGNPMMSVMAERIRGKGPSHEVAICATGDSPQEMEDANASLIAAAPDLLAAAKSAARLLWEIASEVDDGVRTLNEDSAEGKLWAALTDAISKAEGRS